MPKMTTSRKHACEYPLCGKSFERSQDLKRHVMIHTGEKPFKCTECPKEFNQSSMLKTHMNMHTGDKPYQCLYCTKSFGDRSTCGRHIQEKHEKSTFRYFCPFEKCGARIQRKCNFRRHLDDQHKISIELFDVESLYINVDGGFSPEDILRRQQEAFNGSFGGHPSGLSVRPSKSSRSSSHAVTPRAATASTSAYGPQQVYSADRLPYRFPSEHSDTMYIHSPTDSFSPPLNATFAAHTSPGLTTSRTPTPVVRGHHSPSSSIESMPPSPANSQRNIARIERHSRTPSGGRIVARELSPYSPRMVSAGHVQVPISKQAQSGYSSVSPTSMQYLSPDVAYAQSTYYPAAPTAMVPPQPFSSYSTYNYYPTSTQATQYAIAGVDPRVLQGYQSL